MRRRIVVLGTLCVCAAAGMPALAVDLGGTDWVRAPDVVGGWASTHVIVRVVPGVEPGGAEDGRLSLIGVECARDAAVEAAIADTFESWQVSEVTPTADPAPRNAALARQLGLDRYYTVRVPVGSDTPRLAAELSTFAGYIELAELDGIGGILQTFPNDTHFGEQYGLHNTGQNINGQVGTPDADIDAPEAWDLHTGTDEIIVAIIDSGVSNSHPDLAGKLIPGWNTYDNNNNTDDSWLISHGTHCAGIAAAISNNNQGVAGVSWGALIMPIKVLNFLGSGSETQCADGVIWAADHGAHVGSMSLGYPEGISYFENAINYAHAQGMVLVAATGNTPGAPIFPPARWDNVIAVGATDNRDSLASFTTTGPEMSVTAPGVDVYSCWDVLFSANTYTLMSGTSMACPHTAGLACLTWSANLSLTNDEVRGIIESTADDKGAPGWDPSFGYGRINAHAAVEAAMSPQFEPGDLNCDGAINAFDIDPFVLALTDPAGYAMAYPDCDHMLADINGDGTVNSFDIDPFVELLAGP